MIVKEEAYVTAETTRRLVPLDEFDLPVRNAVLDDRSVTWREVGEWFDVPHDVAQRALEQLAARARRRHPTARASDSSD